ncbi:MAG: hypothetical protein HRT69_16245 [Flavobacteriaceae bacterium]|nr:hypothetical protein [Flavobacteriaceae bacterium]
MHWKIIIGFILLPLATLTFFGVIINMINDSTKPIPDGVFVFATLFETIGFTILYTMLFRAKRIEIKKSELILSRIFFPMSLDFKPDDIESYGVDDRCDGNGLISNCYELLQVKTSKGKFHYFLSYEIKQFEDLKKWLVKKKIKRSRVSVLQMYKSEHQLSFICALITTIIIISLVN